MLRLANARKQARGEATTVAWRSAQVFGARLAAQAASFLAAVLVARALGPQSLGIFSLAVVATLLLAQIPGAGIDMSAVRVSGRYLVSNADRARATLFAAGMTKAAVGVALTLLALALAGPAAQLLGKNAEIALALRFAAVGSLAQAMLEFVLAALQARELFGRMVAVSLLSAVLKSAPIALMALTNTLTIEGALAALVVASYAAFGLGALLSWRLWLAPRLPGRDVLRELFDFSGWFTLATLIGALTSNLDLLVISAMLGAQATGAYAAARNLTLPLAFAGSALIAVLLPRLSAMTNGQLLRRYTRNVTIASAALTAGGVAVLAALTPLGFRLVYGEQYGDATVVFQILAVAYGIQLITWPALAYVMVLDRPDIVAALILAVLCVTGVGYLLVVPSAGLVGAAWVFLGGYALQFAAYLPLLWRLRAKGSVHE